MCGSHAEQTKDFSASGSMSEFWAEMQKNHLVWLQDNKGVRPIPYPSLYPSVVRSLANPPPPPYVTRLLLWPTLRMQVATILKPELVCA